jgi:hypothetical protein
MGIGPFALRRFKVQKGDLPRFGNSGNDPLKRDNRLLLLLPRKIPPAGTSDMSVTAVFVSRERGREGLAKKT